MNTTRVLLIVFGLLIATAGQTYVHAEDSTSEDRPDYVRKAKQAQAKLAQKINRYIPSFVFVQGGSGVFISKDGYFLTNYHVVAQIFQQKRQEEEKVDRVINVETVGGTSHRALVVGVDPMGARVDPMGAVGGDLALCKIVDTDSTFDPLPLGNSDRVEIGQQVVALGNPFLRGQFSARPITTYGIISARHVYKQAYPDALQTDAPINPGNSGGPLVTLDGKLIGINGRIETKFGTRANSGVGYAVSASRIRRFLPVLKKGGIVFHAQSSLAETEVVDGELELKYGRMEEGVLTLGDIEEGGKPYEAGLRKGDQVMAIAGYDITSIPRLKGIIQSFPGPNKLEVTYRRSGETRRTQLSFGQSGSWTEDKMLETLPETEEAPYLGIGVQEKESSLKIVKVVDGSPAEESGIREGDVLISINDRSVPNGAAAIRMIQSRWYGETVTVTVKRNRTRKKFTVPLGRRSSS